MKRDIQLDTLRGLLILLVVIAHYDNDRLHDIIFLFHMPLFFILSGFLLNEKRMGDKRYFQEKIRRLMIPYVCYLMADTIFFKRVCSLGEIVKLLWGGRAITGVYWYTTCLLATLVLFAFFRDRFSDHTGKLLIFVGGGRQSWNLICQR